MRWQNPGSPVSWPTRLIFAGLTRRRAARLSAKKEIAIAQEFCFRLLAGRAYPHSYRLRRDNPEWTQGKDGKLKPDRKYLGAPGSGNRLYFPPGVTPEQLLDAALPVVIVEGEKKALALQRLACHEAKTPRFIPIAIAGVWNWRGTVGKTGGPRGERLDVKGPINDLNRIVWTERTVFILFDANVPRNDSVKWARKGFARELGNRATQGEVRQSAGGLRRQRY